MKCRHYSLFYRNTKDHETTMNTMFQQTEELGEKFRNVQFSNSETQKKEKKNLNRIITSEETELVIKNFPTKKSPGLEWLHW